VGGQRAEWQQPLCQGLLTLRVDFIMEFYKMEGKMNLILYNIMILLLFEHFTEITSFYQEIIIDLELVWPQCSGR
jgi:hypothetical protein